MKFTKILLSVVLTLFASTVLAAKPAQELVCHVGSTFGPEGQVYDPECVPSEEYDCSADAGKVDLISVSKKAKHIVDDVPNPSHYFMDDTGFEWMDYYPDEGVGDSPLDFEDNNVDGIDDGCELEEEVQCPCEVAGGGLAEAWSAAMQEVSDDDNNLTDNSCQSAYPARNAQVQTPPLSGSQYWSVSTVYSVAGLTCYVGTPAVFFQGAFPPGPDDIKHYNACTKLINEAAGVPDSGDCLL